MTVDLNVLEDKLKNMLAELDVREAKLKLDLKAIALVQRASGGGETADIAVSPAEDMSPESTPVQPDGEPLAGLSTTMEAPLPPASIPAPPEGHSPVEVSAAPFRFQENNLQPEEPVQVEASADTPAPEEAPIEQAPGMEDTVWGINRLPEAAIASPPAPEPPTAAVPEQDPRPFEEPVQVEASADTPAPQEAPVEQAPGMEETVLGINMLPKTAIASPPAPEPPAAAVPEKDPRPLKEQVSGVTAQDAVLAVLKSWDTRLKSAKIAEELIAAGYSFPGGNPRDLVTSVLGDMVADNKIKKVKTIKGTYFTLL